MFRLFVAIDLPPEIKDRLLALSGGVPGARWLTAAQLHLTLKFVGEVDGGVFQDIVDALGEVTAEPFDLTLKGVGHFPPRREPEVLWVGVDKNERLVQLRNRVEASLARIGLARETRKFAPHVAIARLRDAHLERVARYLAENSLLTLEAFPVTEFALFSSVLASEGAQHQIEAVYRLHSNGNRESRR
ncbi:RNA 2',3'-cyclic phosphodiesterase [candidate division GN15 bacterium]|uniref:RNA 2',3'-cyclic phosphodiesterase n=1 Tax=candidate division GN15 bacterium TaxID=2072418 RepID=A0A855X7N9_9BACT|nr:MAG: RNA 2',3'-cyclic phosphodiesterase [candidate division GN15 bacterium]